MNPDYVFDVEIKEVGDQGTFKGIASVYGVEDRTGDVIDSGAFKKTLQENPTVPILWQHDRSEVIGSGEVKEWQGKILIDGTLDMDDPVAAKAYNKMKRKLIKGLSIGFQTIKSTFEQIEDRIIRHITELKLWEVSVVTFPALPEAQITRVKEADAVKKLTEDMSALRKEVEELKSSQPGAANGAGEPDEIHSAEARNFFDQVVQSIREVQ